MTPRRTIIIGVLLVVASISMVQAEDAVITTATPSPEAMRQSVCALIEHSALTNGIPIEFLTRLIWKESAFRGQAV